AMLLAAGWLALAAVLLGAFAAADNSAGIGRLAGKAAGLVLACIGVAQVAGALSGAPTPWQPLAAFAARESSTAPAQQQTRNSFQKLDSLAGLEQALAQAQGRPVMLDFYADWCLACKELEHQTFADPRVRAQLSRMVLLQADVTRNTDAQQAMLKRYQLFGPPGIVFFDPRGHELSDRRVIGYQDADRFLSSLGPAGECSVQLVAATPSSASC
ncbi:MAG TPA: thioredoxin family protein, partial [Nevskiaceae bacterium]|nr:thioredoxin family protein [Nevskiaceae bacterium]